MYVRLCVRIKLVQMHIKSCLLVSFLFVLLYSHIYFNSIHLRSYVLLHIYVCMRACVQDISDKYEYHETLDFIVLVFRFPHINAASVHIDYGTRKVI